MGTVNDDPHRSLFIFDVETSTWTNPVTTGDAPLNFKTNFAAVMFDQINNVLTVFHKRDHAIYTYHPRELRWSKVPIPSDLGIVRQHGFSAFFDPRTNAYFLYLAYDSGFGDKMLVYRYKQK